MKYLFAMIALASSFNGAAQPQNFDAVQIKPVKVTDQIYMLEGEGGNIGVSFGDDGVFLIDDQYAPLTPKIITAIKSISDKPVRFLLNTHWHADHTGGNENLAG
jgi:cyclase